MKLNLLVLFFLIFFQDCLAQKVLTQLEKYILFEKIDSAQIILKQLSQNEQNEYTKVLNKIATNKENNEDLLKFCHHIRIQNKFEYNILHSFLQKRIKDPQNDVLDLNYVKIKQFHIQIIAYEIALDQSVSESDQLKKYIDSFKQNKNEMYEKAMLFSKIHDILMLVIQKKSNEGMLLCEEYIQKAISLKDTFLIINFKYQMSNFYMVEDKIDEYIENCKEILELENKLTKKTLYYGLTIDNLIDALIFKGNVDEKYIENLLLYRFQNDKLISYSYYAKFVSILDKNSIVMQNIFKLFGVSDVLSLCDTMVKQTKNQLNSNEFYFVLMECSNALLKHKYYEQAFELKTKSNFLLKSIYAGELSQTIADFETNKIKKEKDTQLLIEKSKNQLYLVIVVSIAVFLVILLILAYYLIKNVRILKVRNAEKELLIKEIHHRVKNNFQIITSLFSLQLKHHSDPKTLEMVQETLGRIKTMSLIHQKLYKKDSIHSIHLPSYFEQLAKEVLMIYNYSHVKLNFQIENTELDIDTAIPLGLIFNELLTNSCKYVFANHSASELNVICKTLSLGHFEMIYSDGGQGLPIGFNIQEAKTLGLRLINKLVKQLQGNFEVKTEAFAQFKIQFKDSKLRKEID